MSNTEDYRRIAAYEQESQERARAYLEEIRQLQGSIVPDTTGAKPTPSASGKSVLERALDAYEARTSGIDHVLGTPPAPAPKAAPTAPQGPAKGILDAVMDRHEARKVYPC